MEPRVVHAAMVGWLNPRCSRCERNDSALTDAISAHVARVREARARAADYADIELAKIALADAVLAAIGRKPMARAPARPARRRRA